MSGDGVRVSVDELIRLRQQAQGIALDNLRQVSASAPGQPRSRFRGRGMDFQEFRAYQPGDDIRTMDWRVTARTGRPHVKIYHEERERPVIVLVDLSPSLFFGTRRALKSVVAVRAATLLGWAAVARGDRLGAFLFSEHTHHEIPPAGGQHSVLQLIRDFVTWSDPDRPRDSRRQGSLGAALKRLRRVARPGSLVVLLSDFYSLDADTDSHLTHLRQHNDVLACQIWDTLELTPPPPGHYGITDGTASGVLDMTSGQARQQYEDYFLAHHLRVRELMRQRGVPLLRLATHEDVADSLRRGLSGARASGRRRA